jgi:hypothetical protein
MKLLNFLFPERKKQREKNSIIEQETKEARSEFAQAVVTFERRAHSVTRIAEDAIKSMHRR